MNYVIATQGPDETQQPAIEIHYKIADLIGGGTEYDSTDDACQEVRAAMQDERVLIESLQEQQQDLAQERNDALHRLHTLRRIEDELELHL